MQWNRKEWNEINKLNKVNEIIMLNKAGFSSQGHKNLFCFSLFFP